MEEQEQVQSAKFNVGDTVVLKSADEIRESFGARSSLGVSFQMLNMAGGEFKIKEVEEKPYGAIYGIKDPSRLTTWWFTGDCFKVEEKTDTDETEREEKEIKLEVEEPTDKDIEEMISKVDIETLKNIFKARIYYQQDLSVEIDDKKIHKILEMWAKAKFRFYVLLGRKLKVTKKIEAEKTDTEMNEFLHNLANEFPLYNDIIYNFGRQSWKENSYHGESGLFNRCTKVKRGMKITRILALYGNKDLDMAVSKLYQTKNKVDLNISIDPNDFLTTSINKAWRSCHNFIDGEYRNAGYSLMLDKTSLVNYVAKDKDTEYTFSGVAFKWNNKSWRQMAYISKTNSRIVFSLQYPYSDEKISEKVREIYEKLMSKQLGVENKWLISNNTNAVSVDYHCMYNDIGRAGCKSIINKYDVNKTCEITTGTRDLPKINDLDDIVCGECEDVWN